MFGLLAHRTHSRDVSLTRGARRAIRQAEKLQNSGADGPRYYGPRTENSLYKVDFLEGRLELICFLISWR